MGGKKKRQHGGGPHGERDRGGSPRPGGDLPARRAGLEPLPVMPTEAFFSGSRELMDLRRPVAQLNLQLARLVCSYVGARNLSKIAEPEHGETDYRRGLWTAILESANQVRNLGISQNMHIDKLPGDTMIDKDYWHTVWETFGKDKKTLIEFVGGQLLSLLDRFPLNELPDANLANFIMRTGGGGLTRIPIIDLRTMEEVTDEIAVAGDISGMNTLLRRYMMLYQQFFAYSFSLASMPDKDETWFMVSREI